MKHLAPLALLLSLSFAPGCELPADSRVHLLSTDASMLALRSIQTRAFATTDRELVLRAVIATLQDLDFVIDEADALLGSVSATKLDGLPLRVSVTVRARGAEQMQVRANAQVALRAIEEPEPYQDFFAALERALFLTAHEVKSN